MNENRPEGLFFFLEKGELKLLHEYHSCGQSLLEIPFLLGELVVNPKKPNA
jgi:hypothetical protein